MTARERLQLMIRTDQGSMTVWSPAEVRDALAAYDAERRAEVLTETAADLKAHCLDHNRFAAKGFMDCPCRVADELLRMAKETGRGE